MVLNQIPLTTNETQTRICVHVDPSSPTAWRREPYYSQLMNWARTGMKGFEVNGVMRWRQVVIYVGDRGIVLLPDKEVDLGVVTRHNIFVVVRQTASGVDSYDAIKESFIEEPPQEIVDSQTVNACAPRADTRASP